MPAISFSPSSADGGGGGLGSLVQADRKSKRQASAIGKRKNEMTTSIECMEGSNEGGAITAAVTQQDVSLRFRQEREITAAMPFLRPLYFLLRAKPPNQCCR